MHKCFMIDELVFLTRLQLAVKDQAMPEAGGLDDLKQLKWGSGGIEDIRYTVLVQEVRIADVMEP